LDLFACSSQQLWHLSFAHVNKIVKQTVHVREHLEQVARMKLRFRIQRLEALRRVAESLQQPDKNGTTKSTTSQRASKRRRARMKAWADTLDSKTSLASSLVAISTPRANESSDKHAATARAGTLAMPYVRPSRLSISPRALAKAQYSGQHAGKPLPRVGGRKKKQNRYKHCDGIKYRLSDKYDHTNVIPREILASVVDDFNSGNPELEFPQQQLVSVLGKYLTSTAFNSMNNAWSRRNTSEIAMRSNFKIIY